MVAVGVGVFRGGFTIDDLSTFDCCQVAGCGRRTKRRKKREKGRQDNKDPALWTDTKYSSIQEYDAVPGTCITFSGEGGTVLSTGSVGTQARRWGTQQRETTTNALRAVVVWRS